MGIKYNNNNYNNKMEQQSQLDIIKDLNIRIINAHNAHHKDGVCDLIDRSPSASPNGNQIYHLYSDGEITYQKGAWSYLQRSEFIQEPKINVKSGTFSFPMNSNDNNYVVLTMEECYAFRNEMLKML